MDDDSGSKRARLAQGSGNDSGNEDDSKFTKGTWSKEEDDKLVEAVTQVGTDDWKSVADMVPGRTGKQCRDRYKLKLDPTINHGPWTKSEDDRLLELAAEYGRAWTKIARNMPGRTENAVKSRISSLERSRTKDWSQEEDALLTDLRRQGLDFEQMTKNFPNRSSHAIKKRWETLHMDELTRKLKQDLSPVMQQQHQQQSSQGAGGANQETRHPQQTSLPFSGQSLTSSSPQPHSVTTHAPMMTFANNGMPMIGPFNPMIPMMGNSKLPGMGSQPHHMHPGVQNSRLVRHSTSMTVLLQVLGNAEMPNMLQSSPLRPSGSTMRENSSFTIGGNAPPIDQPPSNDGETPGQNFLKYLINSDAKPSE